MITIITLWIFCGVVSVMIAANKGERGFMMLMLFSILGPIGLVQNFTQKRKPKSYCPYCHDSVDDVNGQCSLCGLELNQTEATEKPDPGCQCPRCGKGNVYDAYIEDGSWGKWCGDCRMSIKKIRRSAS